MNFTPEEIGKLKAMLLFLIKKKARESGGHGGFHIHELNPILESLANDGEVISRPTINHIKYFLNDEKN